METTELKLANAVAATKNAADGSTDSVKTAHAPLNLQATSKYLQLLSAQRGAANEGLQQTLNSVQATLNEYVKDPARAARDGAEAAAADGIYKNLSLKLVERDRSLQERVAQDLSSAARLIRSRDASEALSAQMDELPPVLSEGTEAGKALAKTVATSLASLSDHSTMGAGLVRDLAVRGIYVTENEDSGLSREASDKVLQLSLAYMQANAPGVLKDLPYESPAVQEKPGSTTPQIMTRYLRQALDEFPDDSTYLDIFKKQVQSPESKSAQDQLSRETSERIHELIARAAATARRGNLIPKRDGPATASADAPAAPAAQPPRQEGSAHQTQTSGRELSLSELSARASMLQRQFRMERQRLASEGKLPNPAEYPDNFQSQSSQKGAEPPRDSVKGSRELQAPKPEAPVSLQSKGSTDAAPSGRLRDFSSAGVSISYQAVQSSFYGGIASVPGMDLPVGEFAGSEIKAFADAAQVSSLTSSRTLNRVLEEQQRLESADSAPKPQSAAGDVSGKSGGTRDVKAASAETAAPTQKADAAAVQSTSDTQRAAAAGTSSQVKAENAAQTIAAQSQTGSAQSQANSVQTKPASENPAAQAPVSEDIPAAEAESATAGAAKSKPQAADGGTGNPQTAASAVKTAEQAPAAADPKAADKAAALEEEPAANTTAVMEQTGSAVKPAASTGAVPAQAPAASAQSPAPQGQQISPAARALASGVPDAAAAAETAPAQNLAKAAADEAMPENKTAREDAAAPAKDGQISSGASSNNAARSTDAAGKSLMTDATAARPSADGGAAEQPPLDKAQDAAGDSSAASSKAQNSPVQESGTAKTAAAPDNTDKSAMTGKTELPGASPAEKLLAGTVPAEELDDSDLPADAVKNGVKDNLGRQTAGIINPAEDESAESTLEPIRVKVDKTPGAAVITTGSGAPLPEESTVESPQAVREGGFFKKLASFFGHGEHKADNAAAAAAPAISAPLSGTTAKGTPLDSFLYTLNVAAGSKQLPPEVKEQAQKLIHALEDPVADLASVNSWLSFVAGPMAPDSPRAAAMHGWAFMILCLRFKQLGKSVDKFLKKQGLSTSLDRTLEDMLLPHQDCTDELEQLSSGTLEQLGRLQQLQQGEGQMGLPRYLPLPPSYDGGREGALSLSSEEDPQNGRVWHLNFNFDLKDLGPVEIRAVAALPDVRISYVAERLEGLQAIQSRREELEIELGKLGLNPSSSTPRLGHVSAVSEKNAAGTGDHPDDAALSLRI